MDRSRDGLLWVAILGLGCGGGGPVAPAALPARSAAPAEVPPIAPPPDEATFPDPAVREVLRELAQGLARPGVALRYEQGPAPLGYLRLRVVAAGAAPGSGVASALWGGAPPAAVRGAAAFGALAQARGWRGSPPSAADLAALVDAACFDGMGALHAVEVEGGETLRITGRLIEPPGPPVAVVVEVGPTGPARITRRRS